MKLKKILKHIDPNERRTKKKWTNAQRLLMKSLRSHLFLMFIILRAENLDALDGYSGGITVRHNADGTIMGYLGDKRRDREF